MPARTARETRALRSASLWLAVPQASRLLGENGLTIRELELYLAGLLHH